MFDICTIYNTGCSDNWKVFRLWRPVKSNKDYQELIYAQDVPVGLSREIEIQCSEELSRLCNRCHGADSMQIPVQIVQAALFMATRY